MPGVRSFQELMELSRGPENELPTFDDLMARVPKRESKQRQVPSFDDLMARVPKAKPPGLTEILAKGELAKAQTAAPDVTRIAEEWVRPEAVGLPESFGEPVPAPVAAKPGPLFEWQPPKPRPVPIRAFIPQTPGLPPWSESTTREKAEKVLRIASGIPAHIVAGLSSVVTEPVWAAYKRATEREKLGDYADLTFHQAIDLASGTTDSGFEKVLHGVAEFVGPTKVAAAGLKRLAGQAPKSAIRALETAKVWGAGEAAIQASRKAAQALEPGEAEYGYEGPAAVARSAALGGAMGTIGALPLGWTTQQAAQAALMAGQSAARGGSPEDVFTAAAIPILFATPGVATRFFRGLDSPKTLALWEPPAEGTAEMDQFNTWRRSQPVVRRKSRTEQFRQWAHVKAVTEARRAANAVTANPDDPVARTEWDRVRAKYTGAPPPGEQPRPAATAPRPVEPVPAAVKEGEVPALPGRKEVQRAEPVPALAAPVAPPVTPAPEVAAPERGVAPAPIPAEAAPAAVPPAVEAAVRTTIGQLNEGDAFRYQPDGPIHYAVAHVDRTGRRVREIDGQGRESEVVAETPVIPVSKAALPEPVENQPWEMTISEYGESVRYKPDEQTTDVDRENKRMRHEWIDEYRKSLESQPNGKLLSRNVLISPLSQLHQRLVRFAVEQNKPVPRHVLEEYRGQDWADAALAKMQGEAVQVLTFDDFSAQRGIPPTPPSFPEAHRVPGGVSKPTRKAMSQRIARAMANWQADRNALRKEYDTLVESGKLRPPTETERLEETAQGEGEAAEAAKRVLVKRQQRMETLPAPAVEKPAQPPAPAPAEEKPPWTMTRTEYAGPRPEVEALPIWVVKFMQKGMEPPYPHGWTTDKIAARTRDEAIAIISDRISPPYVGKTTARKTQEIQTTPKETTVARMERESKEWDHQVYLKRGLSSGQLSPSETLRIHKADYPDIETWPEYKEAVQKVGAVAQVPTKREEPARPSAVGKEKQPEWTEPEVPPFVERPTLDDLNVYAAYRRAMNERIDTLRREAADLSRQAEPLRGVRRRSESIRHAQERTQGANELNRRASELRTEADRLWRVARDSAISHDMEDWDWGMYLSKGEELPPDRRTIYENNARERRIRAEREGEAAPREKPVAVTEGKPPYLMTRYEYVQSRIDSTPKKDLRGLGLNELVLKSNDEHKAVVQQALSRGDLTPHDAVAIHKELYPDIKTWKEYKEAAKAAKVPTPAEGKPEEKPEQRLSLSLPDAVAKAFNSGWSAAPDAKSPHLASSPLADAFALGRYAKANDLTGRVRKSRGYTWTIGDNVYRVDSGKVTPTTTREAITGEREEVAAQEKGEPEFPPGRTTEGLGGPLVELGGMPRRPPGLTRAETQYLGRRQREALKAGQATGEKIGYKLGERRTWDRARTVITRIGLAGKLSDENRKEAGRIVAEFLPKEKQGAYIRRIIQARTPRRVARIMESIHTYLDRAHKRQAVRSLKTTVGEIRGRYRRGEVMLGGMEKDLRDRVMAVLDAYDVAKLSEAKAEELKGHEEFVQRIAGTVADAFADWEHLNARGEDILLTPDSRWNELKRLSKTPISQLDADDIEAIEENLRHLVEIQELRSDARFAARRERLAKRINDSTNELVARGRTRKGEVREPGRLRRFAGIENATLRTLARSLGGRETVETEALLAGSLVEGQTKANARKKEWIEAARQRLNPIIERIPKGKGFKDTVTVTLGGKAIPLTYDDLFSLYLHTEATGNMRRLLRAKGMNGWSPRGRRIRTGRIRLEELQAAMRQLPQEYRELAEAYFTFNREFQAPAVNETSVQWQGFPIANLERYWPFPREVGRVPSGPQVDMESAAEAKGRYRPRTGGTQRFNLVPFTAQFMRGLQMDAAYYGTTVPMQDARTLLANEKWREKVVANGGAPVLSEIVTLLRRKEGMITEQTQAEMVMGRTLSRAGRGALSLRPTGSVVQVAGVPAAFEVIESRYFVTGGAPSRKEIQRLEQLSPDLWVRWQANQFDYVLGNISAQNAFDALIREDTSIWDKFVRHYTWGDQVQVYYVWRAAQAKVAAEQGQAAGTAENEKAALKLLDRAMETQGQWDILHRSTLTSNPNVALRGSLMFMSPRTAQYNVLLRAIDDLRKGRITAAQFSERTSGIGLSCILGTVIRRLFRLGVKVGVIGLLLGLGKKDRETAGQIVRNEALQDAAKLPADAAWDAVGLLAFGQTFAAVAQAGIRKGMGQKWLRKPGDYRTGNIFGDIAMDGISLAEDAGTLIHAGITGETETAKATAKSLAGDTAQLVSQFTGAPYSGPMSDVVWPIKAVLSESRRIGILKPRQMRDEVAVKAYGKAWDELAPSQQTRLKRDNPEIAAAETEAKKLRKEAPAAAIDLAEMLESDKAVRRNLPKSTAGALDDATISAGTGRKIGAGFYLNDERYAAYQRYAAEEIEKAAGPLASSAGWPDRTETVRVMLLQREVNQARDRARERLVRDVESGTPLEGPGGPIAPAVRSVNPDDEILEIIASRTYAESGRRPDRTIYHAGEPYKGQEQTVADLKAEWERSTGRKLDRGTLRRAQVKLARQRRETARQPAAAGAGQ